MKRYGITDYEDYKIGQVSRSSSKWGSVSFKSYEFATVMPRIDAVIGKEWKSVVCMGIRNGNEYFSFKQLYPGKTVYGVDINPRVVDVGDNCFAYDFNHLPRDWSNKFDVLYSNSIDHSFDIRKTLNQWYRVVKNGGYFILDLSLCQIVTRCDVYGFVESDVEELFGRSRKYTVLDSFVSRKSVITVVRINKD
jgi:SAM-dependent methyltransferase